MGLGLGLGLGLGSTATLTSPTTLLRLEAVTSVVALELL